MQTDLQEIEKIDKLMLKLNAEHKAYRDDVVHHAGWKEKDAATVSTRSAFMQTLGEVVAAMLPEPVSNAKELCELYFRKPVGIDDIDALIEATTLPCDKSNSN